MEAIRLNAAANDITDENLGPRRYPTRRSATPAAKSLVRLRRLLENSGVTGLSRASKSSTHSTRLFWVFLMFGGVVGFTVNLYHVTQRYLSRPVLNVFTPEYERFIWPDIIVCNTMNPLPFSFFPNSIKNWDNLVRKAQRFGKLVYNGKNFHDIDHAFLMSSINLHDYKLNILQTRIPVFQVRYIKDSITAATGNYDAYMFLRAIGDGFYTRLDSEFFPMPCMSISPSNHPLLSEKQLSSGSVRTLKLGILMSKSDYGHFNCHYADRALHVLITSPNRTMVFSKAHRVEPGVIANIHMTMSRTKRIKEKTKCIDRPFQVELYDAVLNITRTYDGSYDDCRNFISQRLFLENCQCYNPFLPIYRSKQYPPKLCLNITHFSYEEIKSNLDCMNRTLFNYTNNDYFRKLDRDECLQFRSPLCNELSYAVDMDTRYLSINSNLKRKNYLDKIARNVNPNSSVQYLKENFAVIEIEADGDTGDLLSQDFEYPFAQYISDLGGIIGLWVGLSIIGLFELVEIIYALIEYVLALIIARKLTKKNQNHN